MSMPWKKLTITFLICSAVILGCYCYNKQPNTLKVYSCKDAYIQTNPEDVRLKNGDLLPEQTTLIIKSQDWNVVFKQINSEIIISGFPSKILIKGIYTDKQKENISFFLYTGKIQINCNSKINDVFYQIETPVIRVTTQDKDAKFTVSYGKVQIEQGNITVENLETKQIRKFSSKSTYDYLTDRKGKSE